MNRVLALLLLLAGLMISGYVARAPVATANHGTVVRAQTLPGPWEVGKCYRVFPQDRDQFYLFRVVEPPHGGYVRVAAEPLPRLGTGGPPPAPFWLIIDSQFGVQEWPCSPELGR